MKILYVITGLQMGGAEKQLLLIATNLKRNGHEIHVVAMKSGGNLKTDFEDEGIPVTELGITGLRGLVKGTMLYRKVVKTFNPDVVHSHMVHANLYIRLLRTIIPLNRLICTAHSINEGGSFLMSLYRITDKLADLSTNVSQTALDHFIRIKAFDRKKCLYVPNAIDTNLFVCDPLVKQGLRQSLSLTKQDFVFLAVGRLHRDKDYITLFSAFGKVLEVNKNVVLIIVGEGDLESDLKQYCKNLGIDHAVNFLGRRNDISALMNMCNCFVLSSVFEGFGLVVAEAMATETMVIATDCGGVSEVMGGHGILVPVGAIKDLSEVMLKSSRLSSYQQQLSDLGRAHVVKNYSLSSVTSTWLQVYNINFKQV